MAINANNKKAKEDIKKTLKSQKEALKRLRKRKDDNKLNVYNGKHGEGPGVIPKLIYENIKNG